MPDYNEISKLLNPMLEKADYTKVTSEGTGFDDLPDGYYLCEVMTAELTTSKSSGMPMAKFRFIIVEDGQKQIVDDAGNVQLTSAARTKGRSIYINWVLQNPNDLSDISRMNRFVSDMLKFEGEVPGEPLLGKEYFMSTELLVDALDVLKGSRVYIMAQTVEKNETKSQKFNLLNWKRVKDLELPM